MGKRVDQFSFKTILLEIYTDNSASFSNSKKVNIIKLFCDPNDKPDMQNRAVAKIFLRIFDKKHFSLPPNSLDGYSGRDLGNIFNRIIYRGDIKGSDILNTIATYFRKAPIDALQAMKYNLMALFKEQDIEDINVQHPVFRLYSAEAFGNKSAERLVEFVDQNKNDPYLALSILMLISLYPVPSSDSKKADVLESVITKSLLEYKELCKKPRAQSGKTLIYQNRNFIGRQNEMTEIEVLLHDCHKLFIHGIGGIGKTELAKEFAARNKENYTTILFLVFEHSLCETCINERTLKINGISRQHAPNGSLESDHDYFIRKIERLQEISDEHTLIIVDNYDTDYDPDLEFLISGAYTVILTSRIDYSHLGLPVLKLSVLETEHDQKALFQHYYNKELSEDDQIQLELLLKILQGHTLAIELVSKLMSYRHWDFDRMISQLESKGVTSDISGNIPHGFNKPETIYGNIKKIFVLDKLEKEEIQILMNMTLLPLSGFDADEFSVLCGYEDCTQIFNMCNRSWVNYDQHTNHVSLHPLITDVVIQECNVSMNEVETFLNNYGHILEDTWNTYVDEKIKYSEIALTIIRRFPSVSRNRLSLYQGMANLLMLTEYIEISSRLFDDCLNYSCEVFGKKSRETAEFYCNLADNFLSVSNITRSLECIQHSIEIMEEIAPNELRTAYYLKFKVWLLYAIYDDSHRLEIYELLKKCEIILEHTVEPQHPQVGSLFTAYSYYYYYCNDFPQALDYAEKAYDIMINVYGAVQADTLSTLGIKALILSKMPNRIEDAISIITDVIEKQKKIFSPNHQKILLRYERLAIIYFNGGMINKAKETMRNVCRELELKNATNNSFYERAHKQLLEWELLSPA